MGLNGGQPRFPIDHRMVTLSEMAGRGDPLGPTFEVPYRRDFVGIGHPLARHIAANDPTTVLALIARIRDLQQALLTATENIESEGLGASWIRDIVTAGIVLE